MVVSQFSSNTCIQSKENYSSFRNYAVSKFCQTTFSQELERRLRSSLNPIFDGVTSNTVDPGATSTQMFRDLPGPIHKLTKYLSKPPTTSIEIINIAVIDPALDGVGGLYLESGNITRKRVPIKRAAKLTYNSNLAEDLWAFSEKIVGYSSPLLPPAIEQHKVTYGDKLTQD